MRERSANVCLKLMVSSDTKAYLGSSGDGRGAAAVKDTAVLWWCAWLLKGAARVGAGRGLEHWALAKGFQTKS